MPRKAILTNRDLYWATAVTDQGTFVVSATREGVASVLFPGDSALDLVRENPATASSRLAVRNAEKAVFEIVRYISGAGFDFKTPIDLSWATPFMKDVYRTLQKKVPCGETISYGDLAWLSGHPGSARAVGLAMARNRTPLMIPCHRVKHSSGKIGGWSGRPGWKEKLLNHENSLSLSV